MIASASLAAAVLFRSASSIVRRRRSSRISIRNRRAAVTRMNAQPLYVWISVALSGNSVATARSETAIHRAETAA